MLDALRQARLTANPKKCKLEFEEVEFLGYLLGRGHVKPQVRKVHAVRDWPVPCTKAQVKSFLGLAGYYSRFTPNFVAIAIPIPGRPASRNSEMNGRDQSGIQAPEGSAVLPSDSRNARFPDADVGLDGRMRLGTKGRPVPGTQWGGAPHHVHKPKADTREKKYSIDEK